MKIAIPDCQPYSFETEVSKRFCKLLKLGPTFLTGYRHLKCKQFLKYLYTGEEDMNPSTLKYSVAPHALDRKKNNTGKNIILVNPQNKHNVHAALIISEKELTLSQIGSIGIFFCDLDDLIDLCSPTLDSPLTAHELFLTEKVKR